MKHSLELDINPTSCSSSFGCSSAETNALLSIGYSFRFGVIASFPSHQAYWTYAWQKLAKLSKDHKTADNLLCELSTFVQNVLISSSRNIQILPNGCPGLCRDECLAASIIVASQMGPCPALKACAFALLENSHIELCLKSAECFGSALHKAGVLFSKNILNDSLSLTFLNNDLKIFHA